MAFWIYILRCADDSYYTGHTDNLESRIAQHQSGNCDGRTSTRRPVKLVWSQAVSTREAALSAEMQIKGWGRKKKAAMIRSEWQAVNRLGRGKHRQERAAPDAATSLAVPTTPRHALRQGSGHASTSDATRPTLSTNGAAVSSSVQPAQTAFFLGLDFGTSGARACVIDHDKTIVWEQRIAYPDPDPLRPGSGQAQTPADWRAALHALLGALPQHIAGRLQGLAIDGTSGTVLLCDAELEPCSPALLYNDQRALQQAEQLRAIAPNDHTVCAATSGLAKFLWLTRQSGHERAAYFLHQADWLTGLLSGQPGISDYHNALKTGYDVEALRWPDWLMTFPHTHLLPQVVAPGSVIAQIRPDIAAHFGINPQCAIHAGTTDSTAAFIAAGVSQTGVGVTTLGTTLVLKQLSTQRIDAAKYGVYSHRYGELWLAGGASNAGAGVLRRYFDDAQLVSLSAKIDPLQDSPLDYYPLTGTGERFPVSDAQLKPRPLRLGSEQVTPRPGNDAEFLHGLLQGLARIEAAGYARLAELGAPALAQVVTNGGGAKNAVWGTMRERLLGVPVSTAIHCEAAYGSALLCLRNPFT